MSRVVFDIETVGVEFKKLDKRSQEEILRKIDDPDDTEAVARQLVFTPLTGFIIAIGLLNPDTLKGVVYFQAPLRKIKSFEEGGIRYQAGSEQEIIEFFWQDIARYRQFITFNGRAFDAPYLHIRSAIHKIRPSRNLMPYRYDASIHCDLKEQLSFYGAKRMGSLHLYSQAFGFASPKQGEIDGAEIGRAFKQKKYRQIARYCARDLLATAKLFEAWEKYIKPKEAGRRF